MKKGYFFFIFAFCAFTAILLALFLLRNTPGSPYYAGISIHAIVQERPNMSPQLTDGKININTAEQSTLVQLPGIGETTAKKIITYREKNGPFKSVEELMNVEGIDPSKFRQIQNLITVGGVS